MNKHIVLIAHRNLFKNPRGGEIFNTVFAGKLSCEKVAITKSRSIIGDNLMICILFCFTGVFASKICSGNNTLKKIRRRE